LSSWFVVVVAQRTRGNCQTQRSQNGHVTQKTVLLHGCGLRVLRGKVDPSARRTGPTPAPAMVRSIIAYPRLGPLGTLRIFEKMRRVFWQRSVQPRQNPQCEYSLDSADPVPHEKHDSLVRIRRRSGKGPSERNRTASRIRVKMPRRKKNPKKENPRTVKSGRSARNSIAGVSQSVALSTSGRTFSQGFPRFWGAMRASRF
jgi:hypothetical protein